MKFEQVFRATEYGKTSIPIEYIMANGEIDAYIESQNSGYFHILLSGRKLILTAGNYVGLIPINDRVALFVEPKISKINWLHIVDRVNGNLRRIDRVRSYGNISNVSSSVLEFLIDALAMQLEIIEREGLMANYRHTRARTSFPHGQINLKHSISQTFARGFAYSVVVDYFMLSRDTPHNRLLKYALLLSLEYIASLPNQSSDLLEKLDTYLTLLSNIPLDRNLGYMDKVIKDVREGTLPFTRTYYVDALRTAIIIINNTGINPNTVGSLTTLSFVVNMEEIFEKYCQVILKENASILGENIVVKNQSEGKKQLFTGPSSKKRTAEPDIVIATDNDKPLLIIEVKYKSNPNRNDINQAITYALSFNTKVVVILCVADDKYSAGWDYLGTVGYSIDLWIYRLNLDHESLEIAENIFVDAIKELLHKNIIGLEN